MLAVRRKEIQKRRLTGEQTGINYSRRDFDVSGANRVRLSPRKRDGTMDRFFSGRQIRRRRHWEKSLLYSQFHFLPVLSPLEDEVVSRQ